MICPSPRMVDLLLEEGTKFGKNKSAIGCGIGIILGQARSGKTALSWWLLEFVIENTNRHIALIGMADLVLKQLPETWKNRVSNPNLEDILSVPRGSVILIDDSAVLLNSRSSMRKTQVAMNRLYGIFSHLSQTVILTTQNLNTIDIGVFRSTHICVLVRFCERFSLINDPHPYSGKLLKIQDVLEENSTLPYYRDLYFSLEENMLCKVHFPEWLDREKESNKERGTILSKPYGYLKKEELQDRIFG